MAKRSKSDGAPSPRPGAAPRLEDAVGQAVRNRTGARSPRAARAGSAGASSSAAAAAGSGRRGGCRPSAAWHRRARAWRSVTDDARQHSADIRRDAARRRQPPRTRPDRTVPAKVGGTPAVVRGASYGFTILLVGELLVLHVLGLNDGLALYVIAALAYAAAGNRAVASGPQTSVRSSTKDGAMAAFVAYALTIPLRVIAGDGISGLATVVALAFALLVGAGAASIAARARIQMRDDG
jgi:hypothetical protein